MKKIISAMLIAMTLTGSAFALSNTQGDLRKVVTSAGTAVALNSTAIQYKQATVCAETDNTGNITVGASTVVAAQATRRGTPLAAGDCYTLKCDNSNICGNLQEVYIDSTVNGDGVTVHYTQQV